MTSPASSEKAILHFRKDTKKKILSQERFKDRIGYVYTGIKQGTISVEFFKELLKEGVLSE